MSNLGEIFCLGFGHAVEDVRDQRQGVGVLFSHCIELLIILDESKAPILLLMKKTRDAISDLDRCICQLLRFSSRKLSNCFCSTRARG